MNQASLQTSALTASATSIGRRRTRQSNQRGTVLIVVLVAIVLLSLGAYTFTSMMVVEQEASRLLGRQVQSKYLAESGVDYVRLFLSNNDETILEKGGIWDNGEVPGEGLLAITVGVDPSDPTRIGRFTIIAPNLDDDGNPSGHRYGLIDESSKINLNTLPFADTWVPGGGRQLLLALPEMTEEIADAILDWIDIDNEVRDFGTETPYYSSLTPGYEAKNGPMDSIDELLLVRGVTPLLLFGMDTNRNGIIDNDEASSESANSLENDMLLGWANYLTLYSKESNVNSDGLARVNINEPNLEQLYTDLRASLSEDWSKFIVQYRITGPYSPGADEEVDQAAIDEWELPDLSTAEAGFTYAQVLDLIDAYTQTADGVTIPSPMTLERAASQMPTIMESITTFVGPDVPGRINIMQAPRRVLESIPGMNEEILQFILDFREYELNDPKLTDQNRRYETWILVESLGLVDLPTMQMMFPFICAGGDVYKAEIVGFFDDGIGNSRAELIVDTSVPVPRILSFRSKTHIPAAYSLGVLGVDYVEE